MPNNKKAFSLIELIVVIVILSIITAVAVPKLFDTKSSAQISTIKQDITTITSAIQSYYMLNSGISKITDSVNVDKSVWDISDKKLEYKVDAKTCLTIEVDDNKLIIDIDETSGEFCQKLYESNVNDNTIEMI